MKENQPPNDEFSYDVIAYPSQIIPQTHPDRLAAVAKLYGLNPAPPDKCRVLELGCGTGTNLNWFAYHLPESEFVGVDLAQNHIVEAKEDAEELGLQNVEFYQQDVMEIDVNTYGKFDYIIAHGLFSWVPDFVREKVLSLYDELMNPNGVGFISYNVFPGCHRRRIVRNAMRFHTRSIENPIEKVENGVGFIEFVIENNEHIPVYQGILKHEYEGFAKRPLQNIYHDDFAEINQPFYFTEFIAEAEKHNLQFLSESDYLPTKRNHLAKDVAETIKGFSQNLIEYEQYSDFLECRRFRQTLLCKKGANLEKDVKTSAIKEFYVSSELKPTSPQIDLNPNVYKEFISKKGDKVGINHNLTKIFLSSLVNAGSHPVKFDELIENAFGILSSQGIVYEDLDKEIEVTTSLLLQLYSPSAIGFHTMPSPALPFVSEKPIASQFAVWHSKQNELAANFYGIGLTVRDIFTRSLLNLLDGKRTREDLLSELTKIIESSDEIEEKETILAQLPESLDRDLFILAKMGFLFG